MPPNSQPSDRSFAGRPRHTPASNQKVMIDRIGITRASWLRRIPITGNSKRSKSPLRPNSWSYFQWARLQTIQTNKPRPLRSKPIASPIAGLSSIIKTWSNRHSHVTQIPYKKSVNVPRSKSCSICTSLLFIRIPHEGHRHIIYYTKRLPPCAIPQKRR